MPVTIYYYYIMPWTLLCTLETWTYAVFIVILKAFNPYFTLERKDVSLEKSRIVLTIISLRKQWMQRKSLHFVFLRSFNVTQLSYENNYMSIAFFGVSQRNSVTCFFHEYIYGNVLRFWLGAQHCNLLAEVLTSHAPGAHMGIFAQPRQEMKF